MNDRDLLRLLESVETTARGMRPISTGILAGRAARLRSARATPTVQASGAGGGGGQGGGTHSDPTLAAAGAAADRAARVQAEIAQEDEDLALAFRLISNVADRNARALMPPKTAAPRQKPLTGCRSCARDGGHWTPVDEGRYSDLCRRCGDYKAADGRLPPLGAVAFANRTGRRWTTKVLSDALRAEREGRAKVGA